MPATFLLITTSMALGQPVSIDGHFDDWPSSNGESPWNLSAQVDEDAIYLLVHHTGPPRVAQQLAEPLRIGLDLDGDSETGCQQGALAGSELAFILSPRETGQRRGGVLAVSWSAEGQKAYQSPYEHQFLLAPSTASRRHEFRIGRSLLGPATSPIRVLLSPEKGTSISTSLDLMSADPPASTVHRIPSKPESGTRVTSWNIERGGMFKRTAVVSQILSHLDADVLLIQELEDGHEPQSIKRILDAATPGTNWTVALSPKGTGLRSAVATRLKAEAAAGFDSINRVDEPDRLVKAAGLIITTANDCRMLAVSVHLRCCGGLHGPEDMTRISETLAIREAIASAVAKHRPESLVIGGDMNLVASPVPLDVLRVNGQAMLAEGRIGDLQVAKPRHLDDGATYTWYDADSQFTPGQLDFILTGGDATQLATFIFDTSDLKSDQLGELLPAATAEASDHLPVVVDLMTGMN